MSIRKYRGFSLIELLVVMLIISGIVSIVIPIATTTVQSHKTFIEEKKVNLLLKESREFAFYTGRVSEVVFSESSVDLYINGQLNQSIKLENIVFEPEAVRLTASGFLQANKISYRKTGSEQFYQLVLDCEDSFVICQEN